MAWTCPACRRSFGRKNQSHGCAPGITVDGFFADKPPAFRKIFDRIAAHLDHLGPVKIDPVNVAVMFKRERSFAEVRAKKRVLVLYFLLSREITDARITRRLPLSAHRTAFAVELSAPNEVDRVVKDWLAEAYLSSPP